MAILKTVLAKDSNETVSYLFDFSAFPERKDGETIDSATIPAVSGLTIGAAAVTAAERDGVAAGSGVTATVSGGTVGTTYDLEARGTFSSGSIRVVKGQLVVE